MYASDLPACPRCGANSYNGGGGTWGGSLSHQFHFCTECELGVFEYGYSWGHRLRVYVDRDWGATELAGKPDPNKNDWDIQKHRPIWTTPQPLVDWPVKRALVQRMAGELYEEGTYRQCYPHGVSDVG